MLRHLLRFSTFSFFPIKFELCFTSNTLPGTFLKFNNYQYESMHCFSLPFSTNSFPTSEPFDYHLGKVITAHVPSIRFDKVARKGLNISQLDFEKAFYGQSFRLNEEVLIKKSQKLKECDILDLVTCEEDGKVFGKRIVLVKIEEKSNGFIVTLRCYRRIHQLNIDCDEL